MAETYRLAKARRSPWLLEKSWRTQPRVPSGPKGGEWTSGGGFVPLSGVHGLSTEQRFTDAKVGQSTSGITFAGADDPDIPGIGNGQLPMAMSAATLAEMVDAPAWLGKDMIANVVDNALPGNSLVEMERLTTMPRFALKAPFEASFGMDEAGARNVLAQASKTGEITFNGSRRMAARSDEQRTLGYAGENGVVFRTVLPKGSHAVSIEQMGMPEVLLALGSRFSVHDDTIGVVAGKAARIVTLKQVSDGGDYVKRLRALHDRVHDDVGKSWRTQPRVPSGPKGGEWTTGGGFVPLSGVHGLTPEQRFIDAKVERAPVVENKKLRPDVKFDSGGMSLEDAAHRLTKVVGREVKPEQVESLMAAFTSSFPGKNVSVKIRKDDRGVSFHINSSAGTLSRTIATHWEDGTATAHHSHFELYEGHRGHGVAKTLLKDSVDVYQSMGIDRVELFANLTVGGYAWAKFGFVPDHEELPDLVPKLRRYSVDPGLLGKLSSNPKAIWDIADDSTHGKKLLHVNWSGSLNLRDAESVARFNHYVNR